MDHRFADKTPDPVAKVVEVHRLSREAYEQLERAVAGHTRVNDSTTEISAGFQLGIAHVLLTLREGFVNERT